MLYMSGISPFDVIMSPLTLYISSHETFALQTTVKLCPGNLYSCIVSTWHIHVASGDTVRISHGTIMSTNVSKVIVLPFKILSCRNTAPGKIMNKRTIRRMRNGLGSESQVERGSRCVRGSRAGIQIPSCFHLRWSRRNRLVYRRAHCSKRGWVVTDRRRTSCQ